VLPKETVASSRSNRPCNLSVIFYFGFGGILMAIDVLVAGAGPVGLAMACELARYGMHVRIIDKNNARTDKSKALVVWPRTLELIDRMGAGTTDKFLAAGMKIESVNILTGKKQIARADLTSIDSAYKFALMIPQSETERLLEEHLATHGVKVERRTELKSFSPHDPSVTCTIARPDDSTETLDVPWLAGCDGAHSVVRHGLGMEFHGSTMLLDWVLADVHLAGVPGAPAVNIWWHTDGALAVFPLSDVRYRVIADVGESKSSEVGGHRPDPTLGDVQKILDERGPGGITASTAVWLGSFTINERKVSNYRAGRVFLCGDAAHVHSPAGGQGMNTGIHDACNLAWKLAMVGRGACADNPVLSSFSPERSGIAKILLEATGRATQLAVLKGRAAQTIRNHVASLVLGFSPVQHEIADVLTEIAIGYPDSPLNAAHSAHIKSGPAVGKRAPIRASESPVGAGNVPRFALFGADTPEVRAVLAKYPAIVEQSPRAPFDDGGMWLVRPDGYVALVAKAAATSDLDHYLSWLAGTQSTTAR
jgi:2-polyprenyl-6-methoxyphenol hydroxylase-like FAD-dependent oxidoreductase